MKSFFNKLFGNKTTLSHLEKLILDAIKPCLEADLFSLWDQQIAAINKLQRLPDGQEVDFYRMQGGKVSFDPVIAFPNKTKELLVAKVTLILIDMKQSLIAEVWAVNGYIFSIEYSAGSKYFEEVLGMDPQPRYEISCNLIADLSQFVTSSERGNAG